MVATIDTTTPVHTLPREARLALLADVVRYFLTFEGYSTEARALSDAECVLDLGAHTDAPSNYWRTNEFGALVRFRERVASGEFQLTVATPVREDKARQDLGTALAVMRRREADALRDLIALRTEVASLRAQAQGGATWGPDHPEWLPFWRQAAADATQAGNCSEYDRHAREMGGPDRDQFSWDDLHSGRTDSVSRSTIRATVTLELSVTVEHSPEDYVRTDMVREAIEAEYGELSSYDYDVSTWGTEDTETEAGTARFWPVA